MNTFTKNFLPILAGVALLVVIIVNAAQAPVTPIVLPTPTPLETPVEITAAPSEIPSETPSFIVTPAPSVEVTPEPSIVAPSPIPTMPKTDTLP